MHSIKIKPQKDMQKKLNIRIYRLVIYPQKSIQYMLNVVLDHFKQLLRSSM